MEGDEVGIVAISSKITLSREESEQFIDKIHSWGLRVRLGNHLFDQSGGWFPASDAERAADLQSMINDPAIKAVIFFRGGYGAVRALNYVDLRPLRKSPKWLVGYSDLTAVHAALRKIGVESIHGTMPGSFVPDSVGIDYSALSLRSALLGEVTHYKVAPHPLNNNGQARGVLIGGNLALIESMNGTGLDYDLSKPTKQKAEEKLEAMNFCIGCPDDWIESALPTSLKGASMLEDMFTLALASSKITLETVNTPVAKSSFHVVMSQRSIESMNAFYAFPVNTMFILPTWMLEPLYDEQKSDAYNYAIFSVVGHEITHGFDDTGAKYNKIRKLENWWTVSDQMEFSGRQQKLVDCYSLLEILPTQLPGVYANGLKTLGENIADLGGVQLAFDAYNAKLITQGYKGDALQRQHKKFFQSYANLFRVKYSSGKALLNLENDVHSLPQERVNGVVMNIDLWYDLYDVKWGDKLYLKPEKRTYIW